jgi:ketoreductase RED1
MSEHAMSERSPSDVLERYSKVAVIGAGVIGASWTAVFLVHGLTVVVHDPRDDVEGVVNDYIRKASPTLKAMGLPTQDLTRRLRFEADLYRTVVCDDLVKENGPERVEFKQDLWARIEQHVQAHALLLVQFGEDRYRTISQDEKSQPSADWPSV